MSLVSRIKDWFVGSLDADDAKPRSKDLPSRHDRRAAGRERHHKIGAPSWDSSDKVGGGGSGPSSNPDAAPEILGG